MLYGVANVNIERINVTLKVIIVALLSTRMLSGSPHLLACLPRALCTWPMKLKRKSCRAKKSQIQPSRYGINPAPHSAMHCTALHCIISRLPYSTTHFVAALHGKYTTYNVKRV